MVNGRWPPKDSNSHTNFPLPPSPGRLFHLDVTASHVTLDSMGKSFVRVGRWFVALLSLLLRILLWPVHGIWRVTGLFGLWLRRRLTAVCWAAWTFTGRVGLAERHLLARFILRPLWRPLAASGRLLLRLTRAVWAFTGRLGLALRNLLAWFLWRPLLFVTTPLRWFYRKAARPLLAWLWRPLRRLFTWLWRQTAVRLATAGGTFVKTRWRATIPWQRRWERKLHSRWLLWYARWRFLRRRPLPPRGAIKAARMAPPVAAGRRLGRPVMAMITIGVLILVGVVSTQARQPESAIAEMGSVSPTRVARPARTAVVPDATPTVATGILLTPWPTPDPLSSGGSVAFSLRENGNSDIYVLAIGEQAPIRLTSHPAEDRQPAWSPDGRSLAIASNREGHWHIYILDLPGGSLRRVTGGAGYNARPSWSPDGQWLVYESYLENNLDIFIIKADGSTAPIRLTQQAAPDFAPVWSPDGRHIAFTSWRTGNQDVFLMPLDAASDRTAINVTASPGRQENDPAFSPDGRYLAFSDNSTGFDVVYAVPLHDYQPVGLPFSVGQGRHPTWAPNGHSLAFVHSNESRHYLVAGALDTWSIAPQVFGSDGRLSDPNWSAVTLSPGSLDHLRQTSGEANALFVEELSRPQEAGPPYLLWKVGVNAPSPYLSDRVDQSFAALRQRVTQTAGWDFLGQVENMFERPEARPLPGQSNKTWNKAGRAFDFYFRYVLADDPQVEVVREDRGNETYWRVYLRAAQQDGSQGEPLRNLPWDFNARFGFEPRHYDRGGKVKDSIPAGYYVDFTALAADYGWNRVPAADNWRTFFPGIRFWHFQNRQELTWEQALLEIYTADEIRALLEQP
jgi:TolB protein